MEGPVDRRTRIEMAIQNTKSDICLDLTRHEADYGQWMTWEAFSEHMKEAYGSSESGYTCFMRLRVMTQGSNDTVNAYYGHFRRMLNRQKKTMKHPDDKHLYHFMFIAGLKPNINAEVLRLPESLKMEDMKFNEVLELAKRAEQTINSQLDVKCVTDTSGDRKVKMKDKSGGECSSHSVEVSRERLTPREKSFLTQNIERGGGMIVNEGLRKKWEWIKMARKHGVCLKCAAKGHHIAECTVGGSKPGTTESNGGKLAAMLDRMQDNMDSAIHPDSEYLCSISERTSNILMMYHCEVGKVSGTMLTDTGATKNYVSARYAKKANLPFNKGVNADSLCSIRLPNGQDMRILGQCEFELKMSEWTGTVVATILDLEADFDVILGLSWHHQWKPLVDWDTPDMFVNAPEGALRIVHKFGTSNVRSPDVHRLRVGRYLMGHGT